MIDDTPLIPINTTTACQNKWAWSSIYLNTGTSASCHRCKHYEFDSETVMNFHNLPGKKADRMKMIQGEWPGNGCEYCRDVEAVGGISDRYPFYNRPDTLIPEELKADPTATEVTPTILEVYFSNLCNQSCVYCRPKFSSQIEREVDRYGPSKYLPIWESEKPVNSSEYLTYRKKFFEWMTLHGSKLKQLKILGGEPLYQDEFEMLLDFFDKNPCPDLQWEIFTNLNHDTEKLKAKIKKISSLLENNKIKAMQFTCSIDSWGPDIEYIRYGLNLKNAEDNINVILDIPGIEMSIHATMTALSLPSMHLLATKVAEWSKKKFVPFHWNTVTGPACFDVYVFGDTLLEYLNTFIDTLEGIGLEPNQHTIYGIRTRMEHSKPDKEQIAMLLGYLDEIDERRGVDWKNQFPQISAIINKIIGS